MKRFFNFGSLLRTDWTKPQFEKKTLWIVAAIAAVLMLVAPFMSWATVEATVNGRQIVDYHQIGVGTWYGIFALIGAVVTVVGLLYRHYNLAIVGAAFALLMGVVGMLCYEPDVLTIDFGWTKVKMSLEEFLDFWDKNVKSSTGVKGGREIAKYSPAAAMSMVFYAAVAIFCAFKLFKQNTENK